MHDAQEFEDARAAALLDYGTVRARDLLGGWRCSLDVQGGCHGHVER